MRYFGGSSTLHGDDLALALAPALTPQGITPKPLFFSGFAAYPQVLARALMTLADVASTRYLRPRPVLNLDPILTASGDRLRAECFSACHTVYARLDLLQSGLDGSDIGLGTTNVEIGPALRGALGRVHRQQLLHLTVGHAGLTVSSPELTDSERPVRMSGRWLLGLANVAQQQRRMTPAFTLDASQAKTFMAALPSAGERSRSGWLTPEGTLQATAQLGAVRVPGLQRLAAVRRLLTNVRGLTAYEPPHARVERLAGLIEVPALLELHLPGARLSLSLTASPSRGFTGEGTFLERVDEIPVLEDAELISASLAFDAAIRLDRLASRSGLTPERAMAGVDVLVEDGRLGWDNYDQAYYHRELPDEPENLFHDNTRFRAARLLADQARQIGPDQWAIGSGDAERRVGFRTGVEGARCTCAWYLTHVGTRGPCKHVLAVALAARRLPAVP